MNERIKELAYAAKLDGHMLWTSDNGNVLPYEMIKFAELIVRECAKVCYHHSEAAGGVDTAFGYGYKDCGNDIKQHFGVER